MQSPNKYLNAVNAALGTRNRDEQATMLISAAYEIDSQAETLAQDAARLAELFTESAKRLASGSGYPHIRADLVPDLQHTMTEHRVSVTYLRRMVRLVLGPDSTAAFDQALQVVS